MRDVNAEAELTHRPRVSVIIPTYNRAHLLPSAIRSVLRQTFDDFELIVVDDGSTDDTPAVVAQFTDPRIRYVRQENRGIGGAMNTGIRSACGQFIARLDSDDEWLPEMLKTQMAVLDTQPAVGLVYARAQAMDAEGQPLPQVSGAPPRYPGDAVRSILYGDFVSAITTVIRTECFDRAGMYDESLKGNEDWELWIRLARHYQFAFVDRVLARFRQHSGRFTSTSSRFHTEVIEGRIGILDRTFDQPDLPPGLIAIKPTAYRNAHIDAALRWLAVPDYDQAGHHFRQAMRASGTPAETLARIAFQVMSRRVFSRCRLGNALIRWMAGARHRLAVRGEAKHG